MAAQKEPPITLTIHCEKVEEFLRLVSPRSELFDGFDPQQLLYRGHSDAAFPLVPSALRNNSKKLREFCPGNFLSEGDQIRGEKHVLKLFFDEADAAGLPIPEDTQLLRKFLEDYYRMDAWPPDEVLSVMAVAQHHGLPTRLLDWSRHPLKAAYFAAAEAAEKQRQAQELNESYPSASKTADSKVNSTSGRLSVWVMSRLLFELPTIDPLIAIVTAPASSNANLRAQEGVFTRTRPVQYTNSPVDRRPINEIIESEPDKFFQSGTALFHLTLPENQAGRLLWELTRDGVSHSALFPDYYGVVKGLRERRNHRPIL